MIDVIVCGRRPLYPPPPRLPLLYSLCIRPRRGRLTHVISRLRNSGVLLHYPVPLLREGSLNVRKDLLDLTCLLGAALRAGASQDQRH